MNFISSIQNSITKNGRAFRSAIWFVLVGSSAAVVHFFVYAASLKTFELPNEWANACGFGIAFVVSFLGHRYLSFKDTSTSIHQSFLKFFITAVAGFCTNELIFIGLFRYFDLNDWLALLAGICAAAAQTFVLSRFWAFKK